MIDGFGEVPIVGIEDYYTMLRMMKANGRVRWGMIGRSSPLFWDTNFEPGSIREQNHLKKVARQYFVMMEYAKMVFPAIDAHTVVARIFANYYQD